MPNFSVSDRPTRVAQTGTDEALVRNAGASSVYLDVSSAVSPVSYGIELQPFDSVNWPTGSDLWAVVDSGQTSTLTVLYGATGVSLGSVAAVVTGDVTATIAGPVDANITNASLGVTGNVTATIDNASIPVAGDVNATITNASLGVDVNGTVPVDIQNAIINADVTGNIVVDSGTIQVGGIDTPVRVQGGGEVLVNQSGSIASSGNLTINIPAPPSGLTYAGIGVIIRVTASTGNTGPLIGTLYNNGFAVGSPTVIQAHLLTGSIDNMGNPETAQLVAPVGSAFPLRLDLFNGGSGTKSYQVIVVGVAYADTMIRDFGQWEGSEGEISFDNAAANAYAAIAASFETRQYALVSATGTMGAFDTGILLSTGSWETGQIRLQRTANVQADQIYTITIPGDGRIHRVRAISAVTGFVRLSYLGRIS